MGVRYERGGFNMVGRGAQNTLQASATPRASSPPVFISPRPGPPVTARACRRRRPPPPEREERQGGEWLRGGRHSAFHSIPHARYGRGGGVGLKGGVSLKFPVMQKMGLFWAIPSIGLKIKPLPYPREHHLSA